MAYLTTILLLLGLIRMTRSHLLSLNRLSCRPTDLEYNLVCGFLQVAALENSTRYVGWHTEPLLPTANSPYDWGGVDKHGVSSETATGITTLLELPEELDDELVLQRNQLLRL